MMTEVEARKIVADMVKNERERQEEQESGSKWIDLLAGAVNATHEAESLRSIVGREKALLAALAQVSAVAADWMETIVYVQDHLGTE